MFLITPLLFVAGSAVIIYVYKRLLGPIPTRYAILLIAMTLAYLAPTMFTPQVDLPALGLHAYPWKAVAQEPPPKANTGIIFTQIAPWTHLSREALKAGSMPFWNACMGAGSPLLANQQSSIFHPFTLVGLILPLGEAWTLSIALRLFTTLFFSFLLFLKWSDHQVVALFGAFAYSFCVFHVVWLLFPLGLSSMALPILLVGVQEVFDDRGWPAFLLLLCGFLFAVLGGHPESALWVSLAAGVFAVHLALRDESWRQRARHLLISLAAALAGVALTAPVWLPTWEILPLTPRFQAHSSTGIDPVDHGITAQWLAPLVAPNILGTVPGETFRAPEGAPASVPHDYGEIATGYTGIVTLGLALVGATRSRRKERWLLIAVLLAVVLTIYEAPGWMHLVREIPLLGVSLTQRLRLFWSLATVALAVLALSDWLSGRIQDDEIRTGLIVGGTGVGALYFFYLKDLLLDGRWQVALVDALATGSAVVVAVLLVGRVSKATTVALLAMLTLIELLALTRSYNPPARPDQIYRETAAIQQMQSAESPSRVVALGWSFLPDTAGIYGLEDVRTTDPIRLGRYMRLFLGYFYVNPGDYNQQPQKLSEPFVDFMNVRYVYAPPGFDTTFFESEASLIRRYEGPDGVVLENPEAMPRYFLAREVQLEPDFDRTVGRMKNITDYREVTMVDHVPTPVRQAAPELADLSESNSWISAGGRVELIEYGGNERLLSIESRGWNLLASSDVHWPGWRAYWNGKRIPPVIVNGAFVGAFIPPGVGQLRLRYAPASFDRGLRLASWAMGALMVAFLASLMKRWWSRRATPPSV